MITSRRARILRNITWALVYVSLGLVAGWSLTRLLGPPQESLESPSYATVESREGTLEKTISLNASAMWTVASHVPVASGGVVTELRVAAGAEVSPGDVLATIDLRPVTVAHGQIPMFRELGQGASGADVKQLQNMLVDGGFLPKTAADGRFGSGTVAAVKAWQKRGGVEPDGLVRPADVIFLTELPARVGLAPGVEPGARLGDGDAFIEVLKDPRVTISLPEGQASLISAGDKVVIAPGEHAWSAIVRDIESVTDDEGTRQTAVLEHAGDGLICGDACDLLPTTGAILLPADIEIVPPTAGVIVPASAITSDTSGATGVITADGESLDVTVVAAVDGQVVVDGLVPGVRVRAPALVEQEPGR